VSDQIPLDPTAVARRTAARYQRLVGDLVEEVAQLSAYAAHLEQELAAKTPPQTPPTDAWGDPQEREAQDG
jgi:hypothetical protein